MKKNKKSEKIVKKTNFCSTNIEFLIKVSSFIEEKTLKIPCVNKKRSEKNTVLTHNKGGIQ